MEVDVHVSSSGFPQVEQENINKLLRELIEGFSKMDIKKVVEFTKTTLGGEFLKFPEDGVSQCFEELQNQGRIGLKNTELLAYYAENASKNKIIKEKIEALNRRRMKDKETERGFVGRQEDVASIFGLLSSKKTSVLNLYGDPGVGKTTLAERVVELMVDLKIAKFKGKVNLRQMKELRVVCSGILHAFNSPRILKPSVENVYEAIEDLEVSSVLILDSVEDFLDVDPSQNELSFCQLIKGMVERDKHSRLTILLTSRLPLPDEVRNYFLDYNVKPLKQSSSVKVFDNMSLPISKSNKDEISQLCENKPLNLKLARGIIEEKLLKPEQLRGNLEMQKPGAETGSTSERSSEIPEANVISEVFDKFTYELKKVVIKLSLFQRPFSVSDAQKLLMESHPETSFYLCTLKNRGFLNETKSKQQDVAFYEMHPLINSFVTSKCREKNYQEIYSQAKITFFDIFLAKAKQICRLLEKDYLNAYSTIEFERLNLMLSLQISFEMGFLYFSKDFSDISIIVGLFSILIPGQEREHLLRKWSESASQKGELITYINLVSRQILVLLEKSTRRSEAQQLLEKVEEALNKTPEKSNDSYRLAESCYYFAKAGFAYSVCTSKEPNVWEDAAREALHFYKKSLEIQEELLGDHSDTARTLNGIGNCYMHLKDLYLPLQYYTRALEMRRRLTGSDMHVDMPVYFNQIAAVHERMGKLYMRQVMEGHVSCHKREELTDKYRQEFHQALAKYKQALDLEKKLHISGYSNTATLYRNMSNIYSHLEEYELCLKSAKRALSLRKKLLGVDEDTIRSYFQVGLAYEKLCKYEKCLKYFYKAYIMEQGLPKDERSAVKDKVLAKIRANLGEIEEAESLNKRHKEATLKGCWDDETMTSEEEEDDDKKEESPYLGIPSETTTMTLAASDIPNLYHDCFTLGVEGGLYDFSRLGVFLECPPNAVSCPTDIRSRELNLECYPFPAEDNETLVSYIVELGPSYAVVLQEPITVSLIHSGPSRKDGYETLVKALEIEKGVKWQQREAITDCSRAEEHSDQNDYVVQVKINRLTALAVVTRLVEDQFEVTGKGCVVRSSVCSDVTVEFPEGAVDKTVNGSMQLLLMAHNIDIGVVAYPSPVILINGFQNVHLKAPVKIRLPHPHTTGNPPGEVRLFCLEDGKPLCSWKDVSREVNYVVDNSYIELFVDHFSWLWVWIYEVPLSALNSLFQYLLLETPQAVCFAVFKEAGVCSNDALTVTLVCVPNEEQNEVTAKMKGEGYAKLALSTADKLMRPLDKAYTKVEGCYKKKTKDSIFLQFLKNQICRKELPLLKEQEDKDDEVEEDEQVERGTGSEESSEVQDLILRFLSNPEEKMAEHQLCKLSINKDKIVSRHSGEESTQLVPIPSESPGRAHTLPSSELCREVEVYFGALDLRNIGASEAASKVADLLQLDSYKHSVIDPPSDIMLKSRRFCLYLKQHSRQDIIDELKRKLPSGMTGPRRDEKMLFKDIKTQETQLLTRALCGDDKWKMMAEEIGIPNEEIAYYDKRHRDPVHAILREEEILITVGKLYDVLVKCGAAALADKYL